MTVTSSGGFREDTLDMHCSWTLGNGAFVRRIRARRQGVKLASQTSAKVAVQDLYRILPVLHLFGNIMGGVFWKPIFNLLEGAFELLVVNAQHIKAVPGRKTDVRDAEWIADLLQHGLLRPSFIPPLWQREVRDLTRSRTSLVEERSRVINRVQKLLEDANIKLASVASDLLGKSARQMLAALVEGQEDPAILAEYARASMRPKRPL
jgi:transposase